VNLGDRQALIFRAGANGTMVGNYLTSAGRAPDLTVSMVEAQGLSLRAPDTGRPWSFDGHAPHEPDWNERAAPTERRRLPVVSR
jgi:biotin synthase